MKTMGKQFSCFCEMISQRFAGIILLCLAVISFFCYSHIVMDNTEASVFHLNNYVFWIIIIFVIVLLKMFIKVIDGIKTNKLFIILTIIYLIAGFWLIFNTPAKVKGDAAMLVKYVNKFLEGDFSSGFAEGYYLRYCPYQLGMITYEYFLVHIWNNVRFFFILNLFMVIGINFVQWKITEKLFTKENGISNPEKVTKIEILISFLFLPQFFFILFAYGQIPGLFMLEIALYNLIRYREDYKIKNAIACGLFGGVAVLFKNNYLLGCITILIILLLDVIRKTNLKKIVLLIVMAVMMIGMQKGMYQIYRNISGVNFGNGVSMSSVFASGIIATSSDNTRADGWYNGYNLEVYDQAGYDDELASEIGWAKVSERVDVFVNDPVYAAYFFRNKIISTWCEPTFQSLWSGPAVETGFEIDNRILHSLYTDGHVNMAFEKIMNAVIFIIYLLAGAYVFMKKKLGVKLELVDIFPYVYFLGGFLYHLIAETKSQYVYMYVFCMLPYVAYMISKTKKLN
ncbi:MAG: glycosyltransferase family 39 protein [Butyrivibrio sp.]|nr:glycosyltransferase family 39 protein [Butyrivibrio sp.]